MLVMKACKVAFAATLTDVGKAPVMDAALASQIGRDVVAQLSQTFGVSNAGAAQKAAQEAGTTMEEHFASSAKVFIQAPSGRIIVAPAHLPDPTPPAAA
jgi:hypothetical protein